MLITLAKVSIIFYIKNRTEIIYYKISLSKLMFLVAAT